MTRTLSQTSRMAFAVAALAVPFLTLPGQAAAQTEAPPTDATSSDAASPDAAGGGAGADGAVVGGGDTSASETGDAATDAPDTDSTADTGSTTDMGSTTDTGSTADMGTTTGSGESTGSAAQSGGSADMGLTYERVVGDLQSGRDFTEQLDGMDADTTVTVMGLTELQQAGGGSVDTAEEGTPPMTGGQTTIDAPGSANMQSDSNSGASAGGVPDAPAGMSDGAATGGGTQTAAMSEGSPSGIDMALTQAQDSLTTLREALAEHEAVTEALETEDYTAEDVIALHRENAELTVIVDDRDN